MEKAQFLCPSAPLYEGSKLLGIVNEAGNVDILTTPLAINNAFIDVAANGRLPEKRFRFVNKCVKSGCQQWTGESCGVIKRVIDNISELVSHATLPKCNIRESCRWFAQEGAAACKACPTIKYL